MTGQEYIAFLRARNPEVYIQNSSGVPVKWIVTRAYTNGVSAKHRVDAEERDYSYEDTGFFPFAMLMTKEQAVKRKKEIAEEAKPLERICPTCGAIFRAKGGEKYCKTCMKRESHGGSNEKARCTHDHSKNHRQNISRHQEIFQGKET